MRIKSPVETLKKKMELLSLDMGRHAERAQYCNIVVTPNFYFLRGPLPRSDELR